MLKVRNLNLKYDEKVIFNKLNLELEQGKWYTLIGKNGTGKSTLIKSIVRLIKLDGITFEKKKVNDENINEIRKKISVVFKNNNNICEKVEEEIAFPLINIGINDEEINTRIDNILNLFGLKKIRKQEIDKLNQNDKQLVSIMSALVINPKLLILDEAFSYVDEMYKTKVLKYIKLLDITVLNVSHDIEEILYSDNIIILENGKIKANDKKEIIIENKLLKEYPFIVDLSIKLKYYNLVDEIIYDYQKLVDTVWK